MIHRPDVADIIVDVALACALCVAVLLPVHIINNLSTTPAHSIKYRK